MIYAHLFGKAVLATPLRCYNCPAVICIIVGYSCAETNPELTKQLPKGCNTIEYMCDSHCVMLLVHGISGRQIELYGVGIGPMCFANTAGSQKLFK